MLRGHFLGRGGRGGRAHLIQLAREDHHRDRDRGQVLCREGRVREPVSEVTQIMAGVTSSICKEARTGNGGGEGEEGESVVLRDAEWLGVASARGMWGDEEGRDEHRCWNALAKIAWRSLSRSDPAK